MTPEEIDRLLREGRVLAASVRQRLRAILAVTPEQMNARLQ